MQWSCSNKEGKTIFVTQNSVENCETQNITQKDHLVKPL